MADTIILFTSDTVLFLSSENNIEILKQLESPKDKAEGDLIVKLFVRDKVKIRNVFIY